MGDQTYHHNDLKDRLIEKGLQHLNDVGAGEFSLRKVASLCRVSHNAPYRHFKDKEELLQAIMLKAVQDFGKTLAEAVRHYPDEPLEQLKALGEGYVEFFIEKPEYLRLFFAGDLKGTVYIRDGKFLYDEAYLFGMLIECLNQYHRSIGRTEDADPLLAIEFWSMIHGLTTLLVGKKLVFQDDWRKTIAEILERIVRRMAMP